MDPSVTAVNDAPEITITATNNFTEDSDAAVGDVVATYTTSDEDGDTVTVTLSDTTHYALDGNGNVTLTQSGLDLVNTGTDLPAFTLTPNDGTVDGTAATVDPSVTAVNDAPIAKNDTLYIVKGQETDITAQLLSNDTDEEGDTIFISSVDTLSTNGTVTLSNGDISYTSDILGTDSFSYTLSDTTTTSNEATVSVVVAEEIDVNAEETFTFDSNTNNTQIITSFDNLNDVKDTTSNNQTVILQTGNANTDINGTTYAHTIDLGDGNEDKIIFDTAQDIIFQGTQDGGVSNSEYRFLNVENFEIHQVGTLTGSDKDDIVTLVSNNFNSIDLDAGTDTLIIDTTDMIDLSNITNVENIQVQQSGDIIGNTDADTVTITSNNIGTIDLNEGVGAPLDTVVINTSELVDLSKLDHVEMIQIAEGVTFSGFDFDDLALSISDTPNADDIIRIVGTAGGEGETIAINLSEFKDEDGDGKGDIISQTVTPDGIDYDRYETAQGHFIDIEQTLTIDWQ